jgi:hypothetical protein
MPQDHDHPDWVWVYPEYASVLLRDANVDPLPQQPGSQADRQLHAYPLRDRQGSNQGMLRRCPLSRAYAVGWIEGE